MRPKAERIYFIHWHFAAFCFTQLAQSSDAIEASSNNFLRTVLLFYYSKYFCCQLMQSLTLKKVCLFNSSFSNCARFLDSLVNILLVPKSAIFFLVTWARAKNNCRHSHGFFQKNAHRECKKNLMETVNIFEET